MTVSIVAAGGGVGSGGNFPFFFVYILWQVYIYLFISMWRKYPKAVDPSIFLPDIFIAESSGSA